MTDDQRVYSDEEFALILRKATELGIPAEGRGTSSSGLTLTDMQDAATQVGLDPALIERAARMLTATRPASPMERLLGGPAHHQHEARYSVRLSERQAAQLLSAIRISGGLAGSRDSGHSSAMGMTWRDGGDLEALRVTARPTEDGTVVTLVHERHGTLSVVLAFSGMAALLAGLFAIFALYPDAPTLGIGGLIGGIGGVLAGARAFWASSTRKVRERIDVVMDAIGETLARAEALPSGVEQLGDASATRDEGPRATQ
jgi:hypothetical protein